MSLTPEYAKNYAPGLLGSTPAPQSRLAKQPPPARTPSTPADATNGTHVDNGPGLLDYSRDTVNNHPMPNHDAYSKGHDIVSGAQNAFVTAANGAGILIATGLEKLGNAGSPKPAVASAAAAPQRALMPEYIPQRYSEVPARLDEMPLMGAAGRRKPTPQPTANQSIFPERATVPDLGTNP